MGILLSFFFILHLSLKTKRSPGYEWRTGSSKGRHGSLGRTLRTSLAVMKTFPSAVVELENKSFHRRRVKMNVTWVILASYGYSHIPYRKSMWRAACVYIIDVRCVLDRENGMESIRCIDEVSMLKTPRRRTRRSVTRSRFFEAVLLV